MKSIVIFYDDKDSKYGDEKIFKGKSAVELSKAWAEKLGKEVFYLSSSSVTQLLEQMKKLCSDNSADFAIYAYKDLPFLNVKLTEDLINSHVEFKSEYTFADGYPYGFTPELIDAGTLGILAEISKTTQKQIGDTCVSRDSIYNLLKTDINSFEVEAELAPNDWRLYRFAFHCGKKENFMQCKALIDAAGDKIESETADGLSKIASETSGCLKTVPGFYNLQIADKVNSDYVYLPYTKAYEQKFGVSPVKAVQQMAYADFEKLIENIAAYSEQAVVGLSAWGDPLNHPDILKMINKILSYKGLSVFIETDGLLITEEFTKELSTIVNNADERNNGWQKIMIAIAMDSFTAETYNKLHVGTKPEDFAAAVGVITKLQEVLPGSVYPQFTRINDNEAELEGFYRYWNEKTNQSGGNLIIQKYDDFAGLLPPCKPADLSPLDRNPCWHTRRDMTILSNGDVVSCRECILSNIVGNVFKESLDAAWHKNDDVLNQHIAGKYNQMCGKCDEFYTYNF